MKSKIGIIVLLIVIIAATTIGGTVLLINNQNKTQGYVKTKATVVDYKVKTERDYDDGFYNERTMYSEIVEFKVNGVTYRAQNKVWSSSPKSIGKEVEVLYNPDNPNQCEFVKSQHFASLVLYLMGGICLLALVLQIVTGHKMKKKQNTYVENNNGDDNGNIMIA